jgi:hypothetical protein
MKKHKFYLLTIGMFAQYKYAWYEPYGKAFYSNESPKCPKCGSAVGGRIWQPPYDVILKQPRHIGDFIDGPGGCNFLVTEKVLAIYDNEKLSGIETRIPITVKRMGTTKNAKELIPPRITGIYITHSLTQEKWDEMGIIWQTPPINDFCQLCGPASGNKRGGAIRRSRERIVINDNTWQGEDIFYSINGSGIILSEKAALLFKDNKLTNISIIPCEDARHSYY